MNGIWNNPDSALEKLRQHQCYGIITPDFSTYQDFPVALKIYNTYRMRAFGYWAGMQGLQVINNVRWGTSESYDYCFDGIPENEIVAVSTVGCIKRTIDRQRFKEGFDVMLQRLHPQVVMIYGSAPDDIFGKYRNKYDPIIRVYPSRRELAFDSEANS